MDGCGRDCGCGLHVLTQSLTHACVSVCLYLYLLLLLLLVLWLCMHLRACVVRRSLTVGLWPIWHWLTLPYLFMWFWGVIVQIVVIFPVQLQRVLFAGAYLWFMHSYLSLFVV